MSYIIYKAIKGISINGKEYLLNNDKSLKEFKNKKEAQAFIKTNNLQEIAEYETNLV